MGTRRNTEGLLKKNILKFERNWSKILKEYDEKYRTNYKTIHNNLLLQFVFHFHFTDIKGKYKWRNQLLIAGKRYRQK